MSLGSAVNDLRTVTADLASAVAELVMITYEDRPTGSELAVVDRLAETVSEVQSSAVLAGQRVAEIRDPRTLPLHLDAIDAAIAAAAITYWRDLRSFDAVHDLRRAAAKQGIEWRTWVQSIELSLVRCEPPVLAASATVAAAWREVGELLTHYLKPPLEADVPDATHS